MNIINRHIAKASILAFLLTSCSDIIDTFSGGEIEQGEAVVFSTMVPDIDLNSRSAKDEWESKVRSYKAVQHEYKFNVEMWKEGETEATGTSIYEPVSYFQGEELRYDADGTLQISPLASNSLYWQDNVSRWGFRAYTTNAETIASDQSDQTKWLAQDRLVGYSYLPIWNGGDEDGSATDSFDKINYRTSKQWYADNQRAMELSGLMVESNDDYKKIPLFMQHQRSWVTIILKAGEGVTREALAFNTSKDNIHTTIYSYAPGSAPQPITGAWSREELVNYPSDKNGEAATGVSTTRYDAIVEPHNFIADHESQENDVIARISVSDQVFTFAAANDFSYDEFTKDANGTSEATEKMNAYNLKPGKHLTIEATLSRASRMIRITAWVEDWTETVTQTICDDYGKNGDPILINNRAELEDFLKGDNNKAGNVALIVPDALPLTGDPWPANYELKGTLNLAGAVLTTSSPLFSNITASGNLVNGEIRIDDSFNATTALTNTNYGTIERVRVTTSGESSSARASVAGLVQTNYGFIYQCTSALPVYGTTEIVGGIAASNINPTGSIAAIDGCTVTACVSGDKTVVKHGGGIVGEAAGRISNNTYEYGVTLSQDPAVFKNIIASLGDGGLDAHSNNSWPITGNYFLGATNNVEIENNYKGQTYRAVIDNQDELKTLLTHDYNITASLYRIAGSFSVNRDKDESNWIWGTETLDNQYFKKDAIGGTYAHGTVNFCLDGNNKTITLTGNQYATMLFGNILGEVYNLNVVLAKPIVATRIMSGDNNDVDTNSDAISAFAYDVIDKGKISHIMLKASGDAYVESSTPAGIAVWVSEGGTIMNCASNIPVRLSINNVGADARHYAGGIVACAHVGSIVQCKYYNSSQTAISWNANGKSSTCNYGGIVGGTSELADTQNSPSLEIKDCFSWWTLPVFDITETVRPTMGGIIGTTCYNTDMVVHNAMAEGNAGNWWIGNTGAGKKADGITEVQAIGRKNTVTPSKPDGW